MTDVNNNNLGVLLTAGRNLKCHVSLHLSFTLRCVVKGGESLFYLAIPLTGCFGSTRLLKTHTPSYIRGKPCEAHLKCCFFFFYSSGLPLGSGGDGREVENNAAESFIRHPSSRPPSRPPPSRPPPPRPPPPMSRRARPTGRRTSGRSRQTGSSPWADAHTDTHTHTKMSHYIKNNKKLISSYWERWDVYMELDWHHADQWTSTRWRWSDAEHLISTA